MVKIYDANVIKKLFATNVVNFFTRQNIYLFQYFELP